MKRMGDGVVNQVGILFMQYGTLFDFMHCSGWADLEVSNDGWTCCDNVQETGIFASL